MYCHLLLHPRRTKRISPKRIRGSPYDRDLVTCLNELRNYIFGGLRQFAIEAYLTGSLSLSRIQGAVSYFSAVEKGDQFRELHGWLVSILHRAVNERVRIVRTYTTKKKHPFISVSELLDGSWYGMGLPMETAFPNFFSAWRASRKSLMRHGLGGVDAVGMGYSYV